MTPLRITLVGALVGLSGLVWSAVVGAGCASTPAARDEDAPPALVVATMLDVPPAAVRTPDAPGLNVEDLSARLRDALQASSGVLTVDELSVRAELAACVEAPCPDVVAARYRDAVFMVGSSVSRVGHVFLATVRVQRGAREIARATAQDADPRKSLEAAGHDAGASLRTALLGEGAQEILDAPVSTGGPAPHSERGGETE